MKWEIADLKGEFQDEILKETGIDVGRCYQCGKCTAGCPLAYDMDIAPTGIMRLIQLGLRDEAVKANTSWVCVSCQTCTTRCPQDVDIAGVMDIVRRFSKKCGYGKVDRKISIFCSLFLGTVKRFGRLYELGMMVFFNFGSLQPFMNMTIFPEMLWKRKLKIMPPDGAARRAKEIFERCKRMEGQL